MPDLNDNPHDRIGEEWYDTDKDEPFVIFDVENTEEYECEYGTERRYHHINYFEDEIGYRFVPASDA